MPKSKMIAKICPACKAQVPVACKSCPCGHFFYNARRIAREFAIEADYLRRTARVRREKPNYYDALEYDRHIKKLKKRLSESRNEDDDEDYEVDKKDSKPGRKKKTKKGTGSGGSAAEKTNSANPPDEEDMDDPISRFTPEMQVHCHLILEQINAKMQLVMWKPKS